MSKDYISIQDASELSNKSIQTIRRALKAKKLNYRKRKTPQGFNYSISQESLCKFYGLKLESEVREEQVKVKEEKLNEKSEELKKIVDETIEKPSKMAIETEDFKSFVVTMERLFNQHNEERQNFLRLVNTLQEKIFVLENQLNLLKAAPQTKWFQFWK